MFFLKKGKHKFIVTYNAGGDAPNVTKTIILDTTQYPDTFRIKWVRSYIEQKFQSWDLGNKSIEWEREFIGWQIFFALDYASTRDEDFLAQVGELEDLQSSNTASIDFYPREEDTTWHMEVLDTTDEIELRQLVGDDAYEGMRLFFKSKKTVKNLGWLKSIVEPATQLGGNVFAPIEGQAM